MAPVISEGSENWVVRPRLENLLKILIERVNGQVISLCLIDNVPNQLNIDHFISQVESAILCLSATELDTPEFESIIKIVTGSTAIVEDIVLNTQAAGFYTNAIPELAKSILSGAKENSLSAIPTLVANEQTRLVDWLHEQLNQAMTQFLSTLDHKIITAVARSGIAMTTVQYNRYCRYGNAKKGRILQAAQAFPLAAGILIGKDRRYAGIRRTIDRKLPLTPALSQAFNAPKEVVRWLMGMDINRVGPMWVDRLGDLLKFLSHVCPEHRPTTAEEWLAYCDFVVAIEQLDLRTQDRGQQVFNAIPRLLSQIGGIGWTEARRCISGLGAAATDIADMSDLIHEIIQVLAEGIGDGGTISEVLHDELAAPVKDLFLSVGLRRQLQSSLDWHRLVLEPELPLSRQVDAVTPCLHSWLAPFDGALEINGIVVICLTSAPQLKDEGAHMQHCIRNYTDHCLYFGSTILSLRQSDGVRISTVELSLTGTGSHSSRFLVRQHRGYKNQNPSEQATGIVQKLLLLINGRENAKRRLLMQRESKERIAFRRDRSTVVPDVLRRERLEKALKVHVGFDRFYERALQVAANR